MNSAFSYGGERDKIGEVSETGDMANDDFDFSQLSQEEQNVILSQAKITQTAWSFLEAFYTDGDLQACWGLMDSTLKLCWSQWWIDANSRALQNDGYDLPQTAEDLVEQGASHEVWDDFQRVILRDFRTAFPINVDEAGIGAEPRVVAQDVQLVYVHAKLPENHRWKAGEASLALPLVLSLVDGEWKVLNLGSDQIPEPGWPPKLG